MIAPQHRSSSNRATLQQLATMQLHHAVTATKPVKYTKVHDPRGM